MNTIHLALAVVRAPAGRIEENLSRTARWARNARAQGADLICFPELNITGYAINDTVVRTAQPIPGPITDVLQEIAEREAIGIIAGMAEQGSGGRVYAAQVFVCPGQPPATYRKIHIAPPEKPYLSPSDSVPVFGFRGLRFGLQLCYDAHFPELTTRMALEGIDLLLVPHASPRGTPAEKLKSWQRHLPARAFDNGIFVAACNVVGENGEGLEFPGVAVVYGPDGRLVNSSRRRLEGLLVVGIDADALDRVRNHRMRYFFPNRRPEIYRHSLPEDR